MPTNLSKKTVLKKSKIFGTKEEAQKETQKKETTSNEQEEDIDKIVKQLADYMVGE